jgi:Flp pilus assembly protein TadG
MCSLIGSRVLQDYSSNATASFKQRCWTFDLARAPCGIKNPRKHRRGPEVRKRIKSLRCEDGQALVELAVVIPLVLLFLFGIVDFGLALNTKNSDTNLANLAAREVSVIGTGANPKCNGVTEATLSAWVSCMAPSTGATAPTVCVADTAGTTPSSTYVTGDPIKVVVTSSFGWLKLLTGQISHLQSTITGSATMRMEAAPTGGTSSFLPVSQTCTS